MPGPQWALKPSGCLLGLVPGLLLKPSLSLQSSAQALPEGWGLQLPERGALCSGAWRPLAALSICEVMKHLPPQTVVREGAVRETWVRTPTQAEDN